MNLDVLMNFMETANQKSIAKASGCLNITHPALSKQLRKLEAYYGLALFKRSSSGVELTVAGKLLYERLPSVLTELESIRSDLEEIGGYKKIALGTLPSLAAYYMPANIVAMEKKAIHVELTVQNTSELLLHGVISGELDAAMVDGHQASAFLWGREMFREPLYAVVPVKHPWHKKDSISIRDMGGEPFIMYPQACSIRTCVTSLFVGFGMNLYIKTEIPFGDYIPGYVAAGAGVAIVPKLTADHMGRPNLKAIPITDSGACRTISLVAAAETTGKLLYSNITKQP